MISFGLGNRGVCSVPPRFRFIWGVKPSFCLDFFSSFSSFCGSVILLYREISSWLLSSVCRLRFGMFHSLHCVQKSLACVEWSPFKHAIASPSSWLCGSPSHDLATFGISMITSLRYTPKLSTPPPPPPPSLSSYPTSNLQPANHSSPSRSTSTYRRLPTNNLRTQRAQRSTIDIHRLELFGNVLDVGHDGEA